MLPLFFDHHHRTAVPDKLCSQLLNQGLIREGERKMMGGCALLETGAAAPLKTLGPLTRRGGRLTP